MPRRRHRRSTTTRALRVWDMGVLRRRTTPDAVKAVALDRGERRVAWALTTDGEAVVATDRGLHLPSGPTLPWDRIERASFSRPVLTVLELAEVEGAGPSHQVVLDLDGEVTDL